MPVSDAVLVLLSTPHPIFLLELRRIRKLILERTGMDVPPVPPVAPPLNVHSSIRMAGLFAVTCYIEVVLSISTLALHL